MTAPSDPATPATSATTATTPVDSDTGDGPGQSSMYELFMGILTIMSLAVMAFRQLVRVPQIEAILASVDTLFCLIFLVDFARSFSQAPSKSTYLFGARPGRTLPSGLLDLLGSIPSVGIFRAFRSFRLARVARIVQARGATALAREFIDRRAESAIYVIVLASLLILLLGSSAIAFIEPGVEGANIESGSDAFWWAFVTITTVGYGDRFPVTEIGRLVGMLTMAVGIGILGVLTTFMATPKPPEGTAPEPTMADLAAELAAVRRELEAMRSERPVA